MSDSARLQTDLVRLVDQGRRPGKTLAPRAQEVLSEVRVRYDAAQDEMGYYEVELKELRAQIEAVGSSVNELKIRRPIQRRMLLNK